VEVVVGDLDGDEVDEAAAVVSCSTGNSPSSEVLVYRSGPVLIARVPVEEGLDSEVRAHAASISNGLLEVSGVFQDEDDARCCPTGLVVRQYELRGDEVARMPAGLDPDARVTGDGWSTVRVGDDYQQLARATGLPVLLETLEDVEPGAAACTYVTVVDGNVGIIGGEGKIRSVVFDERGVLSKSGVGVGSSEQQVLAAYGVRASRIPNQYVPVDDVVVDAGDGLIVRFEFAEDRIVSRMHAGQVEYASLIEGCA
jgi:hypothetical protein